MKNSLALAGFCLLYICLLTEALQPVLQPKGAAANPRDKKNVAVIGGGGSLGALTFGFLQRSVSLYGTGIGGVRCLGATADTATRLNRVLGQKFCLAFADESFIKLTNLEDSEAISDRLDGNFDAIVWGTDFAVKTMPVTFGTFEKGPNSKTVEMYWDANSVESDVARENSDVDSIKQALVDNILAAAKQSQLSHMVVVDDGSVVDLSAKLEASGVSYTCLQPTGTLNDVKSYTYREGVQAELDLITKEGPVTVDPNSLIPREDVAALAVECLQTLDWTKSRCLQVSCSGAPLEVPEGGFSDKRPDQEWCVNSAALRQQLMRATAPASPNTIVQPN